MNIRYIEKDWNYKIFIFNNGKIKKKVVGLQNLKTANEHYDKLLNVSSKVVFPEQSLLNYKSKIFIPVKYYLVLYSKYKNKQKIVENNINIIEDYLGKKYDISMNGYWIKRIHPYFIEDEIYFCNSECYIYLDEIFNDFILPSKNNYLQVCVIGKILMIEYNDDFLAFRFKNEDDAMRGHNTLRIMSVKNKCDKTLFFGNTLLFTKKEIYMKFLTEKKYISYDQ